MSITIICSNYNSDKWIDGYLKCLDQQSLESFSVVFVDANSTDGSLSKIKSHNFRNGIKVKIIECEDRINIYEAWNLGIENAETEYVMNLNTDDRLYSFGLETYVNYLENNPDVDVFYSPCDVVHDSQHSVRVTKYDWPEYSHETLSIRCICGPFPLLKKSSVVKCGYFDTSYPYAADYEMWLRMSYLGMNFLRIPVALGSYYLNPVGNSTNPENLISLRKEDFSIQSKYKNLSQKKLSILICTLSSRRHYLEKLLSILKDQINRFDEQIEVLVCEDNGESTIGDKRNHLLLLSKGEYVCFIDDDDIVSENYVSLILDAINVEHKPDVIGIHLLHYEDGIHRGLTYHSLKYDRWWQEPNRDNIHLTNYYRNPNHLNPVRREYAVRTMFPSISMGEDRHYSQNILKYLKTESYIETPIYTYLFRTNKEC